MQKQCPDCEKTISFSGDAPKFCSHCGASLTTTADRSTVAAAKKTEALGNSLLTADGKQNVDSTDQDRTTPRSESEPGDADFDFTDAVVGPYELVQRLGQGGMGVVYKGIHRKTGQRVALKLLNQRPSENSTAAERFQRESRIAASISNPRSTFVYESGDHEGRRYIAMELMPGGTVKDLVREQGRLTVSHAVDLIIDVIDGIQSAHRRGIVHRDIKPSNCFVDVDGRVKIGDYGLSKSFESDVALTQTGAFMGTPQFAAPEQIRAAGVDERTDIYAIGATLFYMLVGRAPFEGDAAKVIAGIAAEKAPSVREHADHIPHRLAALVGQMLEKDPRNRPQNLVEVRNRLLPYATQGATAADIGRRFAAFFIDMTVAGFFVGAVFAIGAIVIMALLGISAQTGNMQGNFAVVVSSFIGQLGYFVVAERIWGRGVGKWMFGMRVVDQRGGPPGLFPMILRAMIMPGALLVGTLVLPLLLSSPQDLGTGVDTANVLFTQVFCTVFGWAFALLFLTTCKKSNGYRGIHELLTNTRVVRIGSALAAPNISEVPISVPAKLAGKFERADFSADSLSIIGDLGATRSGRAYMAHDLDLDRPIWYVEDANLVKSIDDQRLHVLRPHRQKLFSYFDNDSEKVCFEAISGAPLVDILKQIKVLSWQTARMLLEELCDEFIAAIEDGTMPATMTVGQVWLDSEGNVKLSDIPFGTSNGAAGRDIEPVGHAVNVLQTLLDEIAEHIQLPGQVIDFIAELRRRRREIDTLQWVQQKLDEFEKLPSTWRWDDRLGTLATSLSTESTAYYLVAFSSGVVLSRMVTTNPALLGGILMTLLSTLAFIFGYWFGGGLVFKLCGVEVRRQRDSVVASKSRCGIRNVIAWLPLNTFSVVTCVFLFTWMLNQQDFTSETTSPIVYLIINVLIMSLSAIVVIGLVQSLLKPARSVQDYICGTFLVRK